MTPLTDIVFSNVNITLTILVIILVVYWLITMISGIDFDLDIDVDIDVDTDVDVDVDASIKGGNVDFHEVANTEVNKDDLERKGKLKWWQSLLIYFNFVGLPFMFTFTCWIFLWWILTTISTTVTQSFNNDFGFILMLGGFFPSLLITKIFTSPFKSFFKNLNQDGDTPINFIGKKGISLSNISDNKLGSAEIIADGNSLNIHIKSLNGDPIKFRTPILIIEHNDDKSFYYAQEYIEESIDITF